MRTRRSLMTGRIKVGAEEVEPHIPHALYIRLAKASIYPAGSEEQVLAKALELEAREREHQEILERRYRYELRDRFAMAALTGLCGTPSMSRGALAADCYKLADAMMVAREA
jgi:hypothetical protein